MCLQVEKTKLTRSSLMAQPAAPLPDMYEYTAARVQIPHGACTCLNKKNLNARVRLETGLQQKLQFKFAVSYGQTHAIIQRVKHKVDICVLKRIIS